MRGNSTLVVCAAIAATIASAANAQDVKVAGTVFIPQSSQRVLTPFLAGYDGAVHAYTNVAVFVPSAPIEPPPTLAATPSSPVFVETPASIACLYGLAPKVQGCNPNAVRTNSTGGSKVIAIVDAYDAPNIVSDLKTFSERFGLPNSDFSVVFANGTRPSAVDKGWEIEISLDVEWAHALAPNAKIILVEAADSQYANLLAAVDKAAQLVAQEGGGQISLSWGGSEFSNEGLNDALHFAKTGITYFAASGDQPGVNYPSTSPQVVAVGGTTVVRDGGGNLIGEKPWTSSGGGPSAYENRPSYQNPLTSIIGNFRGVVDIAAVADPATGVWIYDSGNSYVSTNKGWMIIGGTSAATPIAAAIANLGGRFAQTSLDELSYMYSNGSKFNKILTGPCGPGGVYTSTPNWSFCTGLGSPNGKGSL